MELQTCEKAAHRSYSSKTTIHLCGKVGKFPPLPNRKSMYNHIQTVYANHNNFYNTSTSIFLKQFLEKYKIKILHRYLM